MGSEEKRYALLIDSDNVSAKYIDTIFDELADRGMVTVRRIYGDWARSVNGWNRATLLRIPSFRSSSSPIPRVRMRRIRR